MLPSCAFMRADGRPTPSPRLLLHARDLTIPDRFNFAAAAVSAHHGGAHRRDRTDASPERQHLGRQSPVQFASLPLEHRTQHVVWDSSAVSVVSGVADQVLRSAVSKAAAAHAPTGVRFSSRAPF